MPAATDTAYLVINTGSPAALTLSEVGAYLGRFLSDPRVLTLPKLLRNLLVYKKIIPSRTPRSLDRYRQIWTPEGSPLKVESERLAAVIEAQSGVPTLTAMRYEEDSIRDSLLRLSRLGVFRVILLPLFPHYAMSSFESAVAECVSVHKRLGLTYRLECISPFYGCSDFIDLWIRSLRAVARAGDHVLLSYHSVPLSHLRPYRDIPLKDYLHQCQETSRLILSADSVAHLGLHFETVFQSEMKHGKWLGPSLVDRLRRLPGEGVRRVIVLTPSFLCDCLETILEIGVEDRRLFEEAGGTEMLLLPCPGSSIATARMLIAQSRYPLLSADYYTHSRY